MERDVFGGFATAGGRSVLFGAVDFGRAVEGRTVLLFVSWTFCIAASHDTQGGSSTIGAGHGLSMEAGLSGMGRPPMGQWA